MSLGLLGYRFGRLGGGSAGGPHITFSSNQITTGSSVGTVVGTAVVVGSVSGTKAWSLTNNASATYAISSNTGIVTIISTAKLAVEVETITIAVGGTTPPVTAKSFGITVISSIAPVATATWPGILIQGF